MNKLFLSAFAMSLCLLMVPTRSPAQNMEEFLGLEENEVLLKADKDYYDAEKEVKPDLKGAQRFSPKDLHQKIEWNVDEKQVEMDSKPLKGQGYSIIPWATLDSEEWLSINHWLHERSIKDQIPDWKIRLRDDLQLEHVGKVLQCRGKCDVYRGSMKASVTHLSRINEGDELKTSEDSVAWVYLMDGTLVRVGPSSSIAFLETNWSKSEVFQLIRLNQGHLFWHPRSENDFPLEMAPETDRISLPLLVRDANQAFFERDLFNTQNDFARSFETLKLEETAVLAQIKKLNEMKLKNNSAMPPSSRVMVVSPNGSLVSKKTSFDFFFYPGGKSYFKKRNSLDGHEMALHLRGYSATETNQISEEAWFEIQKDGRGFSKVQNVPGALEITELLTRRIKTLELAREIWLDKYTLPIVKSLGSPKELAINHGLVLWGDDLNRRFDFLVEYMRRIETTNLKSLDNLLIKIADNGRPEEKDISDLHYRASLKAYLTDLKKRYTKNYTQVREMNDLQYYIWILRHGKRKD